MRRNDNGSTAIAWYSGSSSPSTIAPLPSDWMKSSWRCSTYRSATHINAKQTRALKSDDRKTTYGLNFSGMARCAASTLRCLFS